MANEPRRQRRRTANVHDQAGSDVGQIEASVEPVGVPDEVSGGVLAALEGFVGAREHGLEVAERRVDPFELRQVPGLALANDFHRMNTPGISDGGEARQTIAENVGTWCRLGLGPLQNRIAGEARCMAELDIARVAFIVERDSGDERDLVLRATASLAASALPAELGVVNLDGARQAVLCVTRRHRRHDLVVHQPGRRRVADTDLPLQRQGRQARLGLTAEVDRQEPPCQGSLVLAKRVPAVSDVWWRQALHWKCRPEPVPSTQ